MSNFSYFVRCFLNCKRNTEHYNPLTNTFAMARIIVFWFYLLVPFSIAAQVEKPFTIRFQDYLQGDITFIANSIVGKKNKDNANEPYNKVEKNAQLNDEFYMAYTDVDTDSQTFSSSTATYQGLPTANIVFAGLYWSGTLAKKDRDSLKSPITKILLKTPTTPNYIPIEGELLYDTLPLKQHQVNSPYVCFAEVTETIKNAPSGTYTVANIQSSQGKIEGGVAAGWVLYLVYKSQQTNYNYITLYDGFSYVYNKPVTISFTNFQTIKEGVVTPKLLMAALEGDLNIEGDNVRFTTSNDPRWNYISTKNRKELNIFKSSITHFDNHFLQRTPASLNTLGFDAFIENLPHKKGAFNNTTATTLKISSGGDKYYLFTVGFSIEVENSFALQKINERKQNLQLNSTLPKQDSVQSTIQPNENKTRTRKEIKTFILDEKIAKTGYYLIANVYKNSELATNFINNLKKQNIKATKFLNPLNNLYYVVLQKFDQEKLAENAYTSNLQNTYFEPYWIIKIQNPANSASPYLAKERLEKTISTLELPANSSLKKGYYLVTNVFEIPSNALNFVKSLQKKKISATYFINPTTNYYYTYLAYYTDLATAQKDYLSNFNQTYFDEYWIMEVTSH